MYQYHPIFKTLFISVKVKKIVLIDAKTFICKLNFNDISEINLNVFMDQMGLWG